MKKAICILMILIATSVFAEANGTSLLSNESEVISSVLDRNLIDHECCIYAGGITFCEETCSEAIVSCKATLRNSAGYGDCHR